MIAASANDIGGAETCRMARIALDLDRPPVDRVDDHAAAVAADSGSVVANFSGSPGTTRSGIST